MNLLANSHKNPIAVIVVFLILGILGATALTQLPVQLTPNIERPQITVVNFWRSAAPEEMESEIVQPQEEVLQSVVGVEKLSSTIRAGLAYTTIEFAIDANMQQAFIDVVSAINQAPGRPREAAEPQIVLGQLDMGFSTLLIQNLSEDGNKDFSAYQEMIKQNVAPRLRTIEGITDVNLNSYLEGELQITVDPYRMAALGLSLSQLMQNIANARDVSGGFAEVGRREYTVRYNGQYSTEEFGNMVVAYNDGRPVYLQEVATVTKGYREQRNFAYRNNQPAFYITLSAAKNANTIAIMDELKQRVGQINEQILAPHDLNLVLSFDPSTHIKRAIELVKGNLGIGIILAMLMLYAMLRGVTATLLIGITIPVSLLAAIWGLSLMDRSLNIISLAGLAFSTGMVLDAAIVVQENIVRLRRSGLPLTDAAIQGTREVVPALFASTLTTIAIFTPIIFMQGVEGQLFMDLALTMTFSVGASLLAATLLLPVVAVMALRRDTGNKSTDVFWQRLAGLYQRLMNTRLKQAIAFVALLPGALMIIALMMPRADFLPEAKWEGIITVFNVPPGANYAVLEKEIGQLLINRLEPYRTGGKKPAIRDYNIAMSAGGRVLFIYPKDPAKVKDVLRLLNEEILVGLPDTQAFSFQQSLLSMRTGGSRTVYMNFSGDINQTTRLVAKRAMGRIQDTLAGSVVRPLPGLSDKQPELSVVPDDYALAQSGVTRADIGNAVRVLTDGAYAGEYYDGDRRLDIILKGQAWNTPEQLSAMPIYTPAAGVKTLDQLTTQQRTVGPVSLRHVNGQRALTLAITPPGNIPLEDVISRLRDIIGEIQPELGGQAFISLSGGSDNLKDTISTMSANFGFAILILFLLMMALFRSAVDSLLVLLSTPVALAGGVLALSILNLFTHQALDLLTMIGFVILMGLVVNNAILLVDKTRRAQSQGASLNDAISEAVRTRIRPIYMSTLTSVIGMLPLAVIPGIGSEIYRGLAVVIVGGMLASTLFMVIHIAVLLSVTGQLTTFTRRKPTPNTVTQS
ncbi:Nodulation protein NolG [Saliniradius amylolyticus]|uniref:Nodulation protein NolG n=1 Tax=Saliniradius amylolyticus TaxID=2183582 RepID=A0A2S2E223_9ALTE|nr:efflux RND transporter permease subunit [Saliniradius amylolyticus]AWL11572.1 Nodulation protein NolG [Saliniradius amylolyticus]